MALSFGAYSDVVYLVDPLTPPEPQTPAALRRVLLPEGSAGRLRVAALAALAQQVRRDPGPLLMVTRRDLDVPACGAVFGWADRRANVAFVSTSRLDGPGDPGRLWRRAANVAAHELGHLQGRRHCRRPGCLMHPAASVADLDARSGTICAACAAGLRRRARLGGGLRCLPAAILFVLGIWAFDGLALLAGPRLRIPFT